MVPPYTRGRVSLSLLHSLALSSPCDADGHHAPGPHPKVFSFPRPPSASTVTVRVYGAITKLWDPGLMSDLAKDLGMSSAGADSRPLFSSI
jgi:hypothetical protein